jgi:Adenylate and Guanylate cyclase catalytic domain
VVSCANGRFLADHVPDAVYLELPGADHMAAEGDADAIVDAIQRFAAAHWVRAPEQHAERWLATVLFTDIVGSTELAAKLGDRAWRDLLRQFHAVGRKQLDAFRGQEIDTAGDGLFATFDGPARAIRCAAAMAGEVKALGVEIRAGPAHRRSGDEWRQGQRSGRAHRRARDGPGQRGRSAGVEHRERPGCRFGYRFRGARRTRTEGRAGGVAGVPGSGGMIRVATPFPDVQKGARDNGAGVPDRRDNGQPNTCRRRRVMPCRGGRVFQQCRSPSQKS